MVYPRVWCHMETTADHTIRIVIWDAATGRGGVSEATATWYEVTDREWLDVAARRLAAEAAENLTATD